MSEDFKTVTVDREYYTRIEKMAQLMAALYTAGVDNWEGYDEALASVTEADHG